MRAAVLRTHGEPLEIENVERPAPAPHGVVVAVEACGICRSDWHAWQGHGEWVGDRVPSGQILGHEPAGRAVAVGDRVRTVTEGDRVAVPFNLGDGTCPQCLCGHGNVCENGLALGFQPEAHGAFAETVHVPHADYNAMHLPDGVAARDMAALGCRFMTAFHALTARGDVGGGDWVAVHGCGGVGLSAVHVADALGARVVAVDIRDEALDLAATLGADAVVSADGRSGREVTGEVRAVSDGGAHVSVDALGVAETCRNSVFSLRRRGTHLQVGLTTDDERGEVSVPVERLAMMEAEFKGVRGMPPTRYDELLGLLESGSIDPGRLVSREVCLDDVPDRLVAMTDYETTGVEVVTEF
ncbi:zinc-dependent alcohol dehydrogenase family protein [Haloplanus sp.]|uniref:zinc-dependent alcohol dehydrogenase family protein n=1 Tax=Haloplanus sp. TaxID=1961696 RepID=UPI0026246BCB|nr:zinc-dependent alcohol dehydrogenase family protein [Haloplanus sp.]